MTLQALRLGGQVPGAGPVQLGTLSLGSGSLGGGSLGDRTLFQAIAHATADSVVLELEQAPADPAESLERLYPRVGSTVEQLQGFVAIDDMAGFAAAEVRRLTGFDRVLVYRFGADWSGTVIAEDGNGRLPSYLDLRFPASDIPAQARELYRLNRLRLIADAGYRPVPIVPALHPRTGRP